MFGQKSINSLAAYFLLYLIFDNSNLGCKQFYSQNIIISIEYVCWFLKFHTRNNIIFKSPLNIFCIQISYFLGLFYHAAWFTQPHNMEGFQRFLDTILSLDDVWFVTSWQAIQWMRNLANPVDPLNFEPFQCNTKKVNNIWLDTYGWLPLKNIK